MIKHKIYKSHYLLFLFITIISCSKNNIEPSHLYIPDWTEIREESEFLSFFDIDFADDNFGLICGTSGCLFTQLMVRILGEN